VAFKLLDFVNDIFKAKEQKYSKDETAWRKLLRDIARGKAGNAADTLAELERLGKTPEELRSALARFEERTRYAAVFGELPDIEKQLQKTEAELRDAEAAIEAVHLQYEPVVNAAAFEIQNLRNKRARAEDARRQLLSTGNDPVIEGKIDRLARQVQQLDEQIAELRERSRRNGINGGKLQSLESRLPSTSTHEERNSVLQEIEEVRALIAEYSADVARAESEKKSLLEEIEATRQAYLDPVCFG